LSVILRLYNQSCKHHKRQTGHQYKRDFLHHALPFLYNLPLRAIYLCTPLLKLGITSSSSLSAAGLAHNERPRQQNLRLIQCLIINQRNQHSYQSLPDLVNWGVNRR